MVDYMISESEYLLWDRTMSRETGRAASRGCTDRVEIGFGRDDSRAKGMCVMARNPGKILWRMGVSASVTVWMVERRLGSITYPDPNDQQDRKPKTLPFPSLPGI